MLPIKIRLIDRPTTAVPCSSSSSSVLQNIGVSNAVGRVRIYGPHFVGTSPWLDSLSMTSNSWAQASSHIIHKINPTHPLCNPCARHALRPKREGRDDVRVESVIVRGSVKRVYPSCQVRIIRVMGSSKRRYRVMHQRHRTESIMYTPECHTTQLLRVHCLRIL